MLETFANAGQSTTPATSGAGDRRRRWRSWLGSHTGRTHPGRTSHIHSTDEPRRGSGRAPHAPRRVGRLRDPVDARARAGDRPAGEGLLGVRPARDDRRSASRRLAGRAERDLPLDGADPGRARWRWSGLSTRRSAARIARSGSRRSRCAQSDEAEPRRRARPRPHHHRPPRAGSTAPRSSIRSSAPV